MYCTLKDKYATVTWNWADESTAKVYQSSIVPIDVIIAQSGDGIGTWTMITYDTATLNSPFSYTGTFDESPLGVNRTIVTSSTNRVVYSDSSFPYGSIHIKDIKFISNSLSGYTIKILDSSGNLLFQDFKSITTPPNYHVACGQECPNGYCKIDCDVYPGYCCISEAEIQSFINSLK